MGEKINQAPTSALGGTKCPNCNENIIVGIGVHPPEILYSLKPGDLEKRKEDFLKAVDNSTMSEQQKNGIREIYGGDTIIDPVTLQLMHDEIREHYSGVKLGE